MIEEDEDRIELSKRKNIYLVMLHDLRWQSNESINWKSYILKAPSKDVVGRSDDAERIVLVASSLVVVEKNSLQKIRLNMICNNHKSEQPVELICS